MKNQLFAIAAIASTMAFSTPASAAEGSSCHFHGSKPAAESVVVGCANQRRDALVSGGKLDKAWQPVKYSKAEIEGIDELARFKGKEWRVTFNNPAEADKSKQTLYMFFTPAGNFIASNFTGQ